MLLKIITSIGGKLLVYTSLLDDTIYPGKTAEVIDLQNEDNECDFIYNGHYPKVFYAFGGRINNHFVFGGGSTDGPSHNHGDKCYVLGDYGPVKNLTLTIGRRNLNGGLVLPNNTLFVTGKFILVILYNLHTTLYFVFQVVM